MPAEPASVQGFSLEQQSHIYKRRESVFGVAVLLAGLAVSSLCVMPTLLSADTPRHLFLPTLPQEQSFFDILGMSCGCWLLTWMSAVNDWKLASRVGQWVGILLLCAEEALLVGVWRDATWSSTAIGLWVAPAVVQIYILGCFFGFFTLPSLTQINRRLTGLGTLVLLLPWLMGRDAVVAGTEYLHGLVF